MEEECGKESKKLRSHGHAGKGRSAPSDKPLSVNQLAFETKLRWYNNVLVPLHEVRYDLGPRLAPLFEESGVERSCLIF